MDSTLRDRHHYIDIVFVPLQFKFDVIVCIGLSIHPADTAKTQAHLIYALTLVGIIPMIFVSPEVVFLYLSPETEVDCTVRGSALRDE